ncbi:MAG: HAD-IB family phosphatase [bacterium]|nr:HAD-IB family phosphatase [bacterium]MDZ4285068.1 HAD-IB family phosphatase [Patescibacteria group bacterium]
MRKVAIFDIDGTVFRSSIFVELVEALIREGVFPERARRGYEREYHAWLNRRGDYETYITAMVAIFYRHIKGVYYGDLKEVGKKVIREQEQHLYRFTRDLIRDLKRRRYFLLAVSQSPKAVLDPFCKRLGFDKVYGRIYALGPTGRFTGEVEELHVIANKGAVLRRALEKEGLTLAHSIGVGDTEDDAAFLDLVEEPICFNPNHRLYRIARSRGWRVVVERKDVVYEICSEAKRR